MTRPFLTLSAMVLCELIVPAQGMSATRLVPAQYALIQQAVSASAPNDTILVAPGTYRENLFIDRRVALASVAGAEVTTIDGQGLAPVIRVYADTDHVSIEGFRITGGNDHGFYWGAGIEAGATIGTGGYTTIRRNIIEHNTAYFGAGAVMAIRHSIVEDNIIQFNNQTPTNCYASALFVGGTVERNVIHNNGWGGDSRIVWLAGTDTFAFNTIFNNGGCNSIVLVEGGGYLHHNTVIGSGLVGSVQLTSGPPIDFRNNILFHFNGNGLYCETGGSYVVQCNDAWGTGSSFTNGCAGMGGVDGNFSSDPLFCSPSTGDYGLRVESPCSAINSPNGCGLIGALPVGCGVTGVPLSDAPMADQRLTINPNPVRGVGRFEIGTGAGYGALRIFDTKGRLVEQLMGQEGHWEWTPGSSVPAGIYFAVPAEGLKPAEGVKFLYLR